MILDTQQKYGALSKTMHWLSAIVIIALFSVGFYMVDLNYYSQWYRTLPHWHKSIGILLALLTVLRLLWGYLTPSPKPLASYSKLVRFIRHIGHLTLYLILLIIFISGYLISTADGRTIEVFSWFEVASLGALFDRQEDLAGSIHKYAAYTLVAFVIVHIIAALKHHYFDKDATLTRMIK